MGASPLLIVCLGVFDFYMKLNGYKGVPLRVLPVVEPIVLELGYKLWDIEFYKEGNENILCITLDTDAEGGINIEDCEKVSRAIDGPLDEADPIATEYFLQVSSPGIERDLKRAEHIAACEGEKVRIKFFSAVSEGTLKGMKSADVVLGGLDGEGTQLTVVFGGESILIPLEKISGIKTVYEF